MKNVPFRRGKITIQKCPTKKSDQQGVKYNKSQINEGSKKRKKGNHKESKIENVVLQNVPIYKNVPLTRGQNVKYS